MMLIAQVVAGQRRCLCSAMFLNKQDESKHGKQTRADRDSGSARTLPIVCDMVELRAICTWK